VRCARMGQPWSNVFPQRPIEHLDAIVLAGRPEARDERAGTGTIERVAAVATLGEQLPATAAETLDALDDRIFGHGVHDRALRWRMSPADSCGVGTTRFYDGLPSGLTRGMAPNRLHAATASDPHLIPPALVAWRRCSAPASPRQCGSVFWSW
jgi:hypothetical protein